MSLPDIPALTSRRDQICEAIATLLRAVTVDANHVFAWDLVTREPLDGRDLELHHTIGVFDGQEQKSDRISTVTECKLAITLEAHSLVPDDMQTVQGVDSRIWDTSRWGNQVLLEMQLAVFVDYTLDGKLVNLRELANDIAIDGYDDKWVEVILVLEATYRHRTYDPRYAV